MNGYFEEINEYKYPSNKSKEIMKKIYEEVWSTIRDFIRSITENSSENQIHEIKFDLDDDIPQNKAIEIHNEIVVVRAVFHEHNKLSASFLR